MNQLMPISRRTYTTHELLEHWQCRPGPSQESHALKQVYWLSNQLDCHHCNTLLFHSLHVQWCLHATSSLQLIGWTFLALDFKAVWFLVDNRFPDTFTSLAILFLWLQVTAHTRNTVLQECSLLAFAWRTLVFSSILYVRYMYNLEKYMYSQIPSSETTLVTQLESTFIWVKRKKKLAKERKKNSFICNFWTRVLHVYLLYNPIWAPKSFETRPVCDRTAQDSSTDELSVSKLHHILDSWPWIGSVY